MTKSAEQPRPSRRKSKREKEVPGLGLVVLKPPTMGNLVDAEEAAIDKPETERASVLTNHLLAELLVQPKMTPSDVAQLHGETLISVLELAVDVMGIREEYEAASSDVLPRDRFAMAYSEYSGKMVKKFAGALQGIGENLAFKALQESASQLAKLNIPKIMLPSTLAIAGLNAPPIHTPTYQIPEEIELDEEKARRRLNLDAYDMLLSLEITLRDFIPAQLRELHGESWWRRGVPEAVRKDCEARKAKREKDPFASTQPPLAYAYVDDYRSIILQKKNWEEAFSEVFGTGAETETFFMWANRARVDIMHCRLITDSTYQQLTIAANWLQERIRIVQPGRSEIKPS